VANRGRCATTCHRDDAPHEPARNVGSWRSAGEKVAVAAPDRWRSRLRCMRRSHRPMRRTAREIEWTTVISRRDAAAVGRGGGVTRLQIDAQAETAAALWRSGGKTRRRCCAAAVLRGVGEARRRGDVAVGWRGGGEAWRRGDAAAVGCGGGETRRRWDAAAVRRGGGETRRRRGAAAVRRSGAAAVERTA
jgi:hypothetical protein